MKKYMGLILCCSLLLTACGKEETIKKTNFKNSTIQETTTTTATESITLTTKTVMELVTEAATVEQSSENNNDIIMQGLKWSDDINTIKSSMKEYISSFEESYEDETTRDKITCLCYMDIELYNEKCDISFELCNSRLRKISYSYIWNDTKTKSLNDWYENFSDTYGDPSSIENAGMFSCYTWKNIGNYFNLELSSSKYGVDVRITPSNIESNEKEQTEADSEDEKIYKVKDKKIQTRFNNVMIGENGKPCFCITVEEFISDFNSIETDFKNKFDFSDLIHEQVYSDGINSEDVYFIPLYDELSYMGDNSIFNLAVYVNEDLYIQAVKMEICPLYCVDYNIDYEAVFEAMDTALNKNVSLEDAKQNYAEAYDNKGIFLQHFSEEFYKVYRFNAFMQYNNAEEGEAIFNQPDNNHDYYQYTIFATSRE